MQKIINSIILSVEIIGPYIMAYGSTIINAQINDMAFNLENSKYDIQFSDDAVKSAVICRTGCNGGVLAL